MAKEKTRKYYLPIILGFAFLVFCNSLLNDFVWDDEEQIVNNLVIRDWSNLKLAFTSSTFYAGGAGLSGGFYRPLVTLSYFFNYRLWQLEPFGYHLFQICFHLANAALLFCLLKKILSPEDGSREISKTRSRDIAFSKKYSHEIAGLSALLFAIHPANTESVAYIACIGEVLYVFFCLLAFNLFLRKLGAQNCRGQTSTAIEAVEVRSLQGYKQYLDLIFIFGLIFLALLAKESAVVILPLLFLYAWLFLKPEKQIYIKLGLGVLIILACYSFLRFGLAKISLNQGHYAPIGRASLAQRLLTIPYKIFLDLKTIFFPKDLAVSQHFVITNPTDIRFWGPLIVILVLAGLTIFYLWKKKSKTLVFFLSWFAFSLAPTLNLLPNDMSFAERWLYFPLIGLCVSFALVLWPLAANLSQKWRSIIYAILGLMVIVLSIRTIKRNTDWKNGLTLYGHDIQYSKNSYELENNYGVELFRNGQIEQAKAHFEKSIELVPDWPFPHNNLGATEESFGNLEKAEQEYKKAIEYSDYYLAYENLARLLIKMEKFEEAEAFIKKSLLKLPQNTNLQQMLLLIQ